MLSSPIEVHTFTVVEMVESTVKCHGAFPNKEAAVEYINSISIYGSWEKNVYSLDKIIDGQGINGQTKIRYSMMRLK